MNAGNPNMMSRRRFLIFGASVGVVLNAPAFARDAGTPPLRAIAITQVFGDGIRLTAVAVEYGHVVKDVQLSPADFHVEGRTVTRVFTSSSSDPADWAPIGRFVIVELSAQDADASLVPQQPQSGGSKGQGGGPGPGPGGPGKAGSRPNDGGPVYRKAQATVDLKNGQKIATTGVRNLIIDDFQQHEFRDPKTGRTLKYNLFVPRHYDPAQSYPLVLFMHDAGETGGETRVALFQGLGAIAWASPEDQARRPAFVLAPQYDEIIADDDSHTSTMLDTTIDLVKVVASQYNIDRHRLYTTGQSGGCMMSIAMDIKYPGFFAASFLVAGQWDPSLVAPLARQKLWILVSQDDSKAYPGENAITEALERAGAKISRAVWDGRWTQAQFRAAFERIDAEGSPINYVSFARGTVIPPGQSTAGAGGHRNTWRIAYTIEPIREWVFRQHRL